MSLLASKKIWLHNGIDDSELQISNYAMYPNDRALQIVMVHGGVPFYSSLYSYQTNLKLSVHLSQPAPSKVEILWLKVTLPNTRQILIGIVRALSLH